MRIPFLKPADPVSPLSEAEQKMVTNAIQEAEKNTSGEIRVFIEETCSYIDALDRAKEIFAQLKMQETAERNGCLLYIAIRHRQLAIYADQGIYDKMSPAFWNQLVRTMIAEFRAAHLGIGISDTVTKIGAALKSHFPFDRDTDSNELPNDIVFG